MRQDETQDDLLRDLQPSSARSQDQSMVRALQRENQRLRRELQRMSIYRTLAYQDALTGLHNRRYFDKRLREESARAARYDGYPFGVIILDLDKFKQINDEHGHPVGDLVLCAIADQLTQHVRDIDICCRLGGDEFGIVLPATAEAGCRHVVERLRQLTPRVAPVAYEIGFSLGSATHPPGPPDADAVLARADEDMYRQKGEPCDYPPREGPTGDMSS